MRFVVSCDCGLNIVGYLEVENFELSFQLEAVHHFERLVITCLISHKAFINYLGDGANENMILLVLGSFCGEKDRRDYLLKHQRRSYYFECECCHRMLMLWQAIR